MTEKSKRLMTKIVLVLFILIILFVFIADKLNIPIKTYLLAILPIEGGDSGGSGYPDQSPPPPASCTLGANPNSGTGPFNSQITATFSNLPAGTNQALIKCDLSDAGVNIAIANNIATRACSYPLVETTTLFQPRASADVASCSWTITVNPPPPDTTAPTITANPFASAITHTSALVSWTTNEASDSKVRYSTASGAYSLEESDATLSQDHSIVLSNLQSGTTYYFVVTSRDNAGNAVTSNELNFQTEAIQQTGGSSGTGYASAPTNPTVLINEGAENTTITEVVLALGISSNGIQMMISNRDDFEGAPWEDFITIKYWSLSPGTGLKTVYVKFRDAYSNISDIATDTINLIQEIAELPGTTPTSTDPTTTSTPLTQTTVTLFTRDLYLGIKGNDILALQKFLNASNFKLTETADPGSPGNETNYFGPLTKAAVTKFQEINWQEILAPLNLIKGTGYFGPMTRQFINSLLLGNSSGGK